MKAKSGIYGVLILSATILLSGCGEETSFSVASAEISQMDQLPESDRDERDRELEEEVPLAQCKKPGTTKVLVCHVPPGNPAARHTICISAPGASHGHGLDLADATKPGAHGGDTLGECKPDAPVEEEAEEVPAEVPAEEPAEEKAPEVSV